MHMGKTWNESVESTEDLSSHQYKVVDIAGTISAGADGFGILQNKPQSGESMAVSVIGRVKCYAGAAIAAGANVSATTSGWMITTTSGSLANGKALAAANSGDLFPAFVNFANGYVGA